MLSILRPFAITAALALSSLHAQAADFSFEGHVAHNTDLVQIAFTQATDNNPIRLWTDSWQSGLNFDPTLTLWIRSGQGYSLVSSNDDDNSIDAAQGYYDAGLSLPALAAGEYLLTLSAAPNYANGSQLADGFAFDGTAPILIVEWNQPSYDLNANDQKGTFWRVRLSGVASAIPEPATAMLIMAGLGILPLVRRRS